MQICTLEHQMRTTLNIDDKTYDVVRSLAHSNQQTVSATIDQLLANALQPSSMQHTNRKDASDPLTGFPVFSSRRPVSDADVSALLDEE